MLLGAKPLPQAGKREVPRLTVSLWGIAPKDPASSSIIPKVTTLEGHEPSETSPRVPPPQVGGRSAAQGPKAALQVDSFLD